MRAPITHLNLPSADCTKKPLSKPASGRSGSTGAAAFSAGRGDSGEGAASGAGIGAAFGAGVGSASGAGAGVAVGSAAVVGAGSLWTGAAATGAAAGTSAGVSAPAYPATRREKAHAAEKDDFMTCATFRSQM